MCEDFTLEAYRYELPLHLIAQEPAAKRDEARLMIVSKTEGKIIAEDKVKNIASYLPANAVLVFNEVKVIPARVYAHKATGGRVEILLLRFLAANTAEVLLKANKPIKADEKIFVEIDGKQREIVVKSAPLEGGKRIIEARNFCLDESTLEKIGLPPLPPYIKRTYDDPRLTLDKQRYQTVFATRGEAVAAPTAALHFTDALLKELEAKFTVLKVLLNVGLGTFQPVRKRNIREHKMHAETYEIPKNAAQKIKIAKKQKRPIIAIGTTTVRALETAALDNFSEKSLKNTSELFIYPGFNFRIVDGVMTNFHLPGSTLIMMIAAFVGRKEILGIYEKAVEKNYRFYSYGDAMLII